MENTNPYYDILYINTYNIELNLNSKVDNKKENTKNARIRIYDGESWYCFNRFDVELEDVKIEAQSILKNYDIKNFDNIRKYKEKISNKSLNINNYSLNEYNQITDVKRIDILKTVENNISNTSEILYKDLYVEKYFINNDVEMYYNYSSFGVGIKPNKTHLFQITKDNFNSLVNSLSDLEEKCIEFEKYNTNKKYIDSGSYDVIFAPEVTGIMVHECFGHVFEADIRFDNDYDELLCSNTNINICDNGNLKELGYAPFDDDGIIKECTYIIKDGKIHDYLSDVNTADMLNIKPSGNGRIVNIDNKVITRMTNTYLLPDLNGCDNLLDKFTGIYIKSALEGQLYDNFLIIKPIICELYLDGQKKCDCYISTVKIELNDLFNSIKKIGNDIKYCSSIFGGCAKDNQYPMLVSQGGPHILVTNMICESVQ